MRVYNRGGKNEIQQDLNNSHQNSIMYPYDYHSLFMQE